MMRKPRKGSVVMPFSVHRALECAWGMPVEQIRALRHMPYKRSTIVERDGQFYTATGGGRNRPSGRGFAWKPAPTPNETFAREGWVLWIASPETVF
jgi:hypothetical protein